ncbi:uncharacterized protein LOC143851469 [Tasmannia lanceolata]|uniref:uncharacterized protein LOC143851469 n=1 Tax=Tasmannia lanceolata TaxID=3420 RepID=UPI004062F2ED
MEKEQKRQKFHEALMKIFSPPQTPQLNQKEVEDEPPVFVRDDFNEDSIPDADDLEKGNSSSDTNEFALPQKLTRAQRKRVRRKKLKEAASCRRKIIGPLLPSPCENLDCEPSYPQKEQLSKTVNNMSS